MRKAWQKRHEIEDDKADPKASPNVVFSSLLKRSMHLLVVSGNIEEIERSKEGLCGKTLEKELAFFATFRRLSQKGLPILCKKGRYLLLV